MSLYLTNYISWLVLLGSIAIIQGQVMPKLSLKNSSYKINYRVQHYGATYEAVELHSAWQGRSKMHYRWAVKGNVIASNTFYSDGKYVLAVGSAATNCYQVPPSHIDRMLYDVKNNIVDDFEHTHLIGAGRLLSFVETNSADFSLVNTNTKDPVPDIQFQAQFELRSEKFTVRLIHPKDQFRNLPDGIPRSIIITRESSKTFVAFDFTRYQPLKNRFKSTTSSVTSPNQYADYEINSVSYDLFFFDRAIGCSKVLNFEPFAGRSIELIEFDLKRFSFTSRPLAVNGAKLMDMTVVYEPSLSTLRIDQEIADTSIHSIVNFKANRKFHFIEKRNHELEQNPSTNFKRERFCVVSQVKHHADSTNNTSGNPCTLGQMLLGIEHLVYLGLARVRGIEAQVYEAHNCDWPVWLQQPLVYEQSEEMQQSGNGSLPATPVALKWRDELTLMDKQQISMTNVFYFANTNSQRIDFFESNLLLVELFFRDEKSSKTIERLTFPIYDFSWELTRTNPVGERYENSFSLQDHCLASMDENEFASFKILFEAKASSDKLEWLEDSTKRNLAILRMAQTKLHLSPMSMIYDIESRLTIGNEVPNPNRHEPDREISIAVHMRAAERTKSLAQTRFICICNPSKIYFESFKTNNFQTCHHNAAHRQVNTFIAFNVRTSECLIMKQNVALENEPNKLIGEICTFSRISGKFVVYQILHLDKWDREDHLEGARNLLKFQDDFRMFNPMDIGDRSSGLKLRLKSIDISQLNDKLSYNLDELHLSSDKKFSGFGLDWAEQQNKLIDLHSTGEAGGNQPKVMKFEDCQIACLADFECRSFSVCVTRGKMRCVLSTISFNTPTMVLQMMTLAGVKHKFGEKISLRIDPEEQNSLTRENGTIMSRDEFINVLKHPTCELHNKVYRDYFHQMPGWLMFCGADVIIRPVAHTEQCAELCFKRTIDFVRELAQLEKTYGSHVEKDHEIMQVKKACGAYYYISKQRLESEASEALDKHLVENGHQEFVNGFCVLDEDRTTAPYENDAHIKHEALQQITFETYHFNYDTLYAEESGISLANSELADDERKVLVSKVKGAFSKGSSVEGTSENLGEVEECSYATACVPECAKKCFNSISRDYNLKCRSFEYIEIDHPDHETRRFCAMNSITLKSTLKANRLDLIDRGSDIHKGLQTDPLDTVKVWHYEPREGFVAESQKLGFTDQFDSLSSAEIHLGGFGLFLLVVVFISVGVFAGFVGGAKIFHRGQTEEVEGLVERPDHKSGPPVLDIDKMDIAFV